MEFAHRASILWETGFQKSTLQDGRRSRRKASRIGAMSLPRISWTGYRTDPRNQSKLSSISMRMEHPAWPAARMHEKAGQMPGFLSACPDGQTELISKGSLTTVIVAICIPERMTASALLHRIVRRPAIAIVPTGFQPKKSATIASYQSAIAARTGNLHRLHGVYVAK